MIGKSKASLFRSTAVKTIVTISLWHLSTQLASFFALYVFICAVEPNVLVATIAVAVIYIFSPLAGYLADVKYGRLKVLQCSTYLTLVAVIISLITTTLFNTVDHLNYFFYALLILFFAAQLVLSCGNSMYVATILQFGTDQLRDLPSAYTVFFLYAYYWSENLGTLLTTVVNIPGHELYTARNNEWHFDSLQGTLVEITQFVAAIILVWILYLLSKKQKWISAGGTHMTNPYKLVYSVIKFALQHKQIIRRSAFTYCENEYPSRLDFGKQRYGGPFTTEQVEDVKVLLNMVKILVCFGPVFLLDLASKITILVHYKSTATEYVRNNNPIKVLFLDYEMMSPLLIVVCTPVYLLLIKPSLASCRCNAFSRMTLSYLLLVTIFLVFLLYRGVANDRNTRNERIFLQCKRNTSDTLTHQLILVPGEYLVALYNILSSLYQILLYIASWEFICSQSPHFMKGILFGLFYAIRAFYQLLAVLMSFVIFQYWDNACIDCQSMYNLLNLMLGLMCTIIFAIVAKKYRYRKRDDICNVYQYAEDYYSYS